jgi:hypothetical protein
MKPRKKPLSSSESAKSVEELGKYGSLQKYKFAIAHVITFWQDHGRPSGLPENWLHDGLVIDATQAEWRIYLRRMNELYVGFCESKDGSVLRLLMIVPVKETTKAEALMNLRARV